MDPEKQLPEAKEQIQQSVTDKSEQNNSYLVTFDQPSDPLNPKNWPNKAKWMVTGVLSATGFNRITVSTIMAPALTTIAKDLHMNNVESAMSLSVYLLATAFGPLIIGPLSEVYGRTTLIHATNFWFLLWNVLCGFANTKGLLIASRLLAGFGASAVYSLGYGVLGDVWKPEQRGTSLSLYMLIPLLGAALGPILGGFITAYSSWRWMFWSTSCLQAVLAVASIFVFRETYAPKILQRKAVKLRESTGDSRYHTAEDLQTQNHSVIWVLQHSLSRPLRLLMFHPIIQIQALLSGFNYGLLYFALSSFAELYTNQYKSPIQISGLHYIALAIGEVAASQLTGPATDRVFRVLTARNHGTTSAEYRVPLMIPGAALTPIGLLLYGWAAQHHRPWPAVDTGMLVLSFGMQSFGNALQAYVIDAYPDHVGSASAATQLFRSLAAFGFPLFASRMYDRLGYGWGNSLLALVAVAVGVPVPLLLWRYGAGMRAKARSSH